MKIDRVVFAANEQELYTQFWAPVARAWRKLTGYTPTLIQVGPGAVDETLGDIIRLDPLPGIPTSFSAQVSRLLIPALYPDQVSLISDIDMLPLSGRYFQELAAKVTDDVVLVFSADRYQHVRYPMCYLAAKGSVFGEVLGLPERPTLQDVQAKIREWNAREPGWHTDEVLFARALHAWRGYPAQVVLRKRGGWNPAADHRVDRAAWHIDEQRLAAHDYIDAHLPRPLFLHLARVRPLFRYLELTDLASLQVSAPQRLRLRIKYPWRDKLNRGLWRYVWKTARGEIAAPHSLLGRGQTLGARLKGRLLRMSSRFRSALRLAFGTAAPAGAPRSNGWRGIKQGLSRGYPPVLGYTRGAPGPYSKRALLTYVAFPFYQSTAELAHSAHSNGPQALEIANALNRLGYVVDIVDWQDVHFVPTTAYELFMGMHQNFIRLLPYLAPSTRKIFYATRVHVAFETAADAARVANLETRRGVRLTAATGVRDVAPDGLADAVIVMGNEFVQSTFRERGLPTRGIDNSNIPTGAPDLERKDFAAARRNFLWIGGNGLVHKGLDLVLEAFAELELNLWVCGELQSPAESGFVHCYREELFSMPTIHPMGWVDIHSAQFRQLTDRCGFVIHLPAAEGMATSVLVAMGRGLIPVVNREVGLDVGEFGFTLDTTAVGEIRERVQELARLPVEQCRAMAKQAYEITRTRYTYEKFAGCIENALRSVIPPSP